jgi:hypothetical protein
MYTNRTLVNEVADAYKRHFSKVDPHWKEKNKEECEQEPSAYSKDCLVDLPLIIFPSRARLILQLLDCGIDILLLDTDVTFGPSSLTQFLNSGKLVGDMFLSNERGMDCDRIIPAITFDSSQSKWELTPGLDLHNGERWKIDPDLNLGSLSAPKFIGYHCEGRGLLGTQEKRTSPLELNCGVQLIKANQRTIKLMEQWISFTNDEIFDDQNALNVLIARHMNLAAIHFGGDGSVAVPEPASDGIATVYSALEPDQETLYTEAVAHDQVAIQVLSMRSFSVSLDIGCYGEDVSEAEIAEGGMRFGLRFLQGSGCDAHT